MCRIRVCFDDYLSHYNALIGIQLTGTFILERYFALNAVFSIGEHSMHLHTAEMLGYSVETAAILAGPVGRKITTKNYGKHQKSHCRSIWSGSFRIHTNRTFSYSVYVCVCLCGRVWVRTGVYMQWFNVSFGISF